MNKFLSIGWRKLLARAILISFALVILSDICAVIVGGTGIRGLLTFFGIIAAMAIFIWACMNAHDYD